MEEVPIHDEPKGLFDDDDDEEDGKIFSTPNRHNNIQNGTKNGHIDKDNNIISPETPATLFTTPSAPINIVPSAPPMISKKFNETPPILSTPSPPACTSDEKFDLEPKLNIAITGYEKRGDGMQSHVVFKVVTKPVPGQSAGFTKKEYDVWRRFSDFLGLHDKLAEKHLPNGIIIPPAPEKNVLSSTKSKITRTVEDDPTTNEFLEQRRAMLQRFLQRCCLHPTILLDPDFRDFLTLEADLPKSTQTATLSGANVLRLLGKVGDSFTRIAVHIDDTDTWFQDKQQAIDDLDDSLKKLHGALEVLINQRKEFALSIDLFCKSFSLLAACEDNTSLSKALSVLSETLEKVSALQQDQADKDLYMFSEVIKDYVGIVASIREVFQERVKAWQAWQNAQLTLTRKRENKTRLELAGKSDKVPGAKKEVQEFECKVQECEDNFAKLSRVIRREIARFDAHRINDMTHTLVQYFDTLAETQQKLTKYWEAYLPEAKAVVS